MKILVVEASAVHLGFVGCYGNEWVATPNLDRLAAESVVFDQHIADAPEPFAAASWWQRSAVTGCYAFPGSDSRHATPDRTMFSLISYSVVYAIPTCTKLKTTGFPVSSPWCPGMKSPDVSMLSAMV